MTTSSAITVCAGTVVVVAVHCAVVLAGTALALIFVVPSVPGTELATTFGAVTFVTVIATTGRTTIVLTFIALVAVHCAVVLAHAIAVAAIISIGKGQTTALRRSALPTTGSTGPLSLNASGVAILARAVAGAGILLTVVVAIATNQTLAGNDWVFAKLRTIINTHIACATLAVITTIRSTRTTGVITT